MFLTSKTPDLSDISFVTFEDHASCMCLECTLIDIGNSVSKTGHSSVDGPTVACSGYTNDAKFTVSDSMCHGKVTGAGECTNIYLVSSSENVEKG